MRVKVFVAALAAFLVAAGGASAASSEIVVRGTFLVAHADGRGGAGDADFYLLKTRAGYFDLEFTHAPAVQPNQPVVVTGDQHGRELFVSRIEATEAAAQVAQASQTLDALVMLVSWPSAPPDLVTPAQAAAQVGGTDNAWYEEVSYGSLGMAAIATPWMTIADPGAGCPLGELVTEAESAAVAEGFDPSAYDREIVYVPWTASLCPGFAGFGLVPGRITWILGEMDTRVTVHELGHNLGLWHSHSATCFDASGVSVPFGPSCTLAEYGDPFDAMGTGFYGVGHFNAAQKKLLGWMANRYGDVTPPLKGPVKATLTPLEIDGGLKALAIHADGTTFWIEYRTAIGVDSWLNNWPGALNGVLVHIPQPSDASNGSNLLDMTPTSTSGFFDAALPVGMTYTDPGRSFTLVVRSTSATEASLVVRRPTGKK
jgi:Gametolysin peptidase M11